MTNGRGPHGSSCNKDRILFQGCGFCLIKIDNLFGQNPSFTYLCNQ